MNRCKTCRWWKMPPEGDEYEEGWGAPQYATLTREWHPYDKLPVEFEVRYCKHPKLLFCERPLERNTFAVADGSEYMAHLFTAEDFGCMLHEEKTNETQEN